MGRDKDAMGNSVTASHQDDLMQDNSVTASQLPRQLEAVTELLSNSNGSDSSVSFAIHRQRYQVSLRQHHWKRD